MGSLEMAGAFPVEFLLQGLQNGDFKSFHKLWFALSVKKHYYKLKFSFKVCFHITESEPEVVV